MREIKFRAWDKSTNKMILNVTPFQFDFVIERGIWICTKSRNADGEAKFEVYGHTYDDLMQYTEKQDNIGKDIYEGDILEIYMGGSKQDDLYVVKNMLEFYFDCNREDSYYRITHTEVIGNIYENTELLEK